MCARVSLHDYLLNVVAATVEVCESVARPRVCVHECICAAISQCSPLRSVKRVSQLLIVSDRQVKGSERKERRGRGGGVTGVREGEVELHPLG